MTVFICPDIVDPDPCPDCGDPDGHTAQDCWNCGGHRRLSGDPEVVRERFCSVECADEFDRLAADRRRRCDGPCGNLLGLDGCACHVLSQENGE